MEIEEKQQVAGLIAEQILEARMLQEKKEILIKHRDLEQKKIQLKNKGNEVN